MRAQHGLLSFAIAAAAFAMTTAPALAGPGLISFTSPAVFLGQTQSLGYRFTANSSSTVTALGFYDDARDGLVAAHDVGIFDIAGNLLASASVPTGTTGNLIGDFRYANLGSALSLSAGTDYYIAGEVANDGWVFQAANIVTDPAISYVASYFAQGSPTVLTFPETLASDREYMTVNLLLDGGRVPEPATLALLGLALASLGFARRKLH